MQTGTIARLTDRGFGFIQPEGKDKDLFFHVNDLEEGTDFDSLQEGDAVSFELVDSSKGPKAINVQRV